MKPIRIALVAGEASGDLLASHLIASLKKRMPEAIFYGIGGPKMQAQGFEALWPSEKLAVRGYIEVLRHYREITGIRRDLLKRLKVDKPDLFIGVDAPDFNLWLEGKLKRAGITAIHFVSPSIWAWRGERIRKIVKSVSHLLAIFPFEPALYAKYDLPVTYVGHPLADVIPMDISRADARERLCLGEVKGPVFALLPGSRQSELQYMAETFIETGKCLLGRFPAASFLVPLVSRETRNLFEENLWKLGAQDMPFKLLFGHAQDAMAASDAVLVASGTATLEAALLKRPMVITYKMSPWTWKKMNKMRYQPWVGLPNVLAEEFVVPELLQDDATPENLAQALGNMVVDKEYAHRVENIFSIIHEKLRQDTAYRATETIVACLPETALAA